MRIAKFSSKKFSKIVATGVTLAATITASSLVSITVLPANAQSEGCGSGWTGRITPNRPAGVSFKEPCNRHDACYDTYNGPSKQDCDKQFHRDMLDTCARKFHTFITKPLRINCNGAADVYYTAVIENGGKIFREAREEAAKKHPQASGRFIKNSLSGKCIDVAGAPGQVNGAQLQLWNCEVSGRNADNGSPTDQTWVITNDGFIKNTLSGKCIDVAGAPGQVNGAQLQLWDCEASGRNADNGSPTDQTWVVTNDGFIKNTLSGKCIDVAGAPGQVNGAQLQLWDCEASGRNADNGSSTDQTWSL